MHLFALIPGQGASQLLRQLADVLGKRSNNSRRVLAGDLDEHREAGIALDEGSDVRVVRSGKKVSFPMPPHSAILNLGGPLADRDHIEDMPLSTLRVVALGVTHPPRSTQLRRQLLFQHAAGLDEEVAIDRPKPCRLALYSALRATPAPWHADQPGLHDRPDCRQTRHKGQDAR